MKTAPPLAVCALALLLPGLARAQMGDPSKVTLKTTPITEGLFVIEGANGFSGGNVGVSVGGDGVLVIDDALEPMTPKLRTALAALSKKPVRFLVNTHLHGDHTGGNAALGRAGAVIVAHYNVRKRLSAEQFLEFMGQKKSIPASPAEALPVVTFNDDLTFFFNGDEIHVMHVPPAHTDGDAIVHFKKANVIHMGDTLVSGYPFVDMASGGSFEGYITAADRVLALADDNTKLIPGHGPLMTKADLQAWRDMLVKVHDKVAALAAKKKTLAEIEAAKPTEEFDAQRGQGMIKPDMLVEAVWKSLPPAPAAAKAKRKR